MAAVIHAYKGDRSLAAFKSVQEKSTDTAHGMNAVIGTVLYIGFYYSKVITGHILQSITFLGKREAYHLKGRGGTDLLKSLI